MQLSEIQQDLYFQAKINSSTYSSTDILRIINKYYQQVRESLRSINEGYFDRQYITDYVSGESSYGLDPTWDQLKKVYLALNPADKTAPLTTDYLAVQIVRPEQINSPAQINNLSNPVAVLYADYFILYPVNPANTNLPVTGGVKVVASVKPVTLTNATDTPDIPLQYHDIISIGSAIDIAERQGNESLKNTLIDRYKQRIYEMKADLSPRTGDLPSGIIEGQMNFQQWTYPYGFKTTT